MPSSIKLKAELGDDFNVLFVESQNTPPDETEAFIYRQRWGASQGLWTNEAPCGTDGNGLPFLMLLGNDGRVLIKGYPADSKLKELANIEIKAFKSAPKDTPPALSKAYVDFSKGAYASAILAAKKLAETPAAEDKLGVGPKAAAIATEWTQRATSRIERLKFMIDNAQFAKADAEVLALKPAIKGLPELETKLSDFTTRLAGDDQKNAREAAKALDGLLAKVNDKGVDDKTAKELKKIAEKFTGTPPGERAGRLAKLLEKKSSSG